MEQSKRTIILFIIGLILVTKVRFMYPMNIEQREYAIDLINQMPREYIRGVKLIKFYNDVATYYDGWYLTSGVIGIDSLYPSEWDRIIRHEIVHNYCWRTDRYLGHNDCFIANYNKIYN